MRERCKFCGNRISSKSRKLFENSYSLPIPATTNEEIATLKEPKNSTSFETLVKVPLAQSVIYGVLFSIPGGFWYASAMETNPVGPILSIGFFASGLAWTWHSHFFNSLLKPIVEVEERPPNNNQPPVILEITDGKNNEMLNGSISSDIATTEDIIEFAKIVKRDVSRRPRQDVNLTQAKFTKAPNKVFSQPRWTEFVEYLESMKLVERKGNSRNSTYILTRTGRDFIYKYSELEL